MTKKDIESLQYERDEMLRVLKEIESAGRIAGPSLPGLLARLAKLRRIPPKRAARRR